MKNKLSIAYLFLIIAPLFFGCGGPIKEGSKNKASASSLSLHVGDEKYVFIDTKESVVAWKGGNLIGSNNQTGYVYISKGELMMENGQLTGGAVEVDMNTIEDKNHGSDNKLVHHLKDPDFFEVEKFPFSTIAITRVASINGEDKEITGNLTIKGITHPVTFPAKLEVVDGVVKADGKLVIDRTLWDVRYKSGKFYANLADQAMSDSIEFHIKIVAKIKSEATSTVTSSGPDRITRNIIQDGKGNIWLATWEGIFRYDGRSFTNITSKVSSARFFSVLEDSKGNLWFGSIGSGAYYYDGKSFQNFTTKDGLLNNDVGSIYEDKKGNIWFGVFGGASRYDGTSFRNYIINGDAMNEDRTGKTFPERPPYEVNAIIEDKTGKFWFATRGNTFVYDGKTFTVFTHEDKPFKNVRSIIEDKKGSIWLGGADGLWGYDGSTFTNFTQQFVGYITEDKKGNIWTSSERGDNQARALSRYDGKFLSGHAWELSRYDEKSLSDKTPVATEIASKEGMIFGILTAHDGSIWFGTGDGVYRYDGSTITSFKGKKIGNKC